MSRFLRNRELNNASWIIGEQIFQMCISLVIGVISARYLGPSNYGLVNYTASFVNFVIPIVTLGMDGVIIKKIIEFPEKEGLYLGSCIALRICSAILCATSVILIVWILNPNDLLMLSLISLQSIQLIFRAVHLLDSWFQRYLKSKFVSIAKIVACVCVAGYRIYLLVTLKDVRWFAFSNSLSAIVIMVILIVAYKKNSSQKLKVSFNLAGNVMNESYHFIISGVMAALYSQMDRIMLGEMISSEAVGLYTTASLICTMWLFVPTSIINSYRPSILQLKHNGDETQYIKRLCKLYSVIIYLCMFVSIAVFFVGTLAIKILYGKAFIGATSALKILIWSETFSMIGTARGIWILAEKKNKYVKYYLGMGTVLNFILNLYMIPYWGIEGAAVATLITQFFTSIIAPLCFKETRRHTYIVLKSLNLKKIFIK